MYSKTEKKTKVLKHTRMQLRDVRELVQPMHMTEVAETEFVARKTAVRRGMPWLCGIEAKERKEWHRTIEAAIVCFSGDLVGVVEAYCFGGPLFLPPLDWQQKQATNVAFFHATDCVRPFNAPPYYNTRDKVPGRNGQIVRMGFTRYRGSRHTQWKHQWASKTIDGANPGFDVHHMYCSEKSAAKGFCVCRAVAVTKARGGFVDFQLADSIPRTFGYFGIQHSV